MGENVARVKKKYETPHIIYGFIINNHFVRDEEGTSHHIYNNNILFIFRSSQRAEVCTIHAAHRQKNYFFTASLKLFPALKLGYAAAGIFNGSPVFGFLPSLADLILRSNVPNPVKVIFSPAATDAVTTPKAAFTTFSATFFSTPAASATASTNAFLLIEATAEYGLFFIYSRFTCAHRRGKSLVSIRSISVTMMTMKNVVVVKGSLSREKREQ
jgi:hypothetical protein